MVATTSAGSTTRGAPVRGSDGCVHFSQLKGFALSPAHYREACQRGGRIATPAMRRGTIVDRLIFGGEVAVCPLDKRQGNVWECFVALAARQPVVVFPGERRGKPWAAFKAEHHDVEQMIFTQREHDDAAELVAKLPAGRVYAAGDFVTWSELAEAEPIARALQTDPLAREYLAGRHQVPLRWEQLGLPCATGGIDVVGDDWLSDLKVTQTTHPDRLGWHARRMLWHAQLAWYAWGAVANGIRVDKGLFLVGVEATAPHPVTVLRLSQRAIDEGQKACHLWLEQLRACEASGEWPGYAQSVLELDVEIEPDFSGLDEPEAEAAAP